MKFMTWRVCTQTRILLGRHVQLFDSLEYVRLSDMDVQLLLLTECGKQ